MKKVKVNDVVAVIAGSNKGKSGKVLKINTKTGYVTVEGVNEMKRSVKPSQTQPEGGFVTKILPIHRSNVALLSPKTKKPTRVKILKNKEKKNERHATACGSKI